MTLLVVLLLVALGGALVFLWAAARSGRSAEAPPQNGEWLDQAREMVLAGRDLRDRLATSAGTVSALTDDQLADITAEVGEYSSSVAALSATAPTPMDTRVCRELGVRAREVGAVYQREQSIRAASGNASRPTLRADARQNPGGRLDEFGVALRDLEVHVELL